MSKRELCKIIRKHYKAEQEALREVIDKQKGDERKYRNEYYFNAGKEWAWNDIAHELGVELYNEDFELLGEDE